ncbi:MAG: helix-turn-helix transcriptional regulator [Asticcacaulis sp.]
MTEDRILAVQALTPRQREILRLVARNLQVKEIARELGISERTVKTHTDAARRRLGVATSREAARLVMAYEAEHGIVPEGHRPPGTMDDQPQPAASSEREHLPRGKVSATPVRGDLQARLDSLNPLQWLALIVAVAVVSALLATGLIAAVLGAMNALQGFLRAGGAI